MLPHRWWKSKTLSVCYKCESRLYQNFYWFWNWRSNDWGYPLIRTKYRLGCKNESGRRCKEQRRSWNILRGRMWQNRNKFCCKNVRRKLKNFYDYRLPVLCFVTILWKKWSIAIAVGINKIDAIIGALEQDLWMFFIPMKKRQERY